MPKKPPKDKEINEEPKEKYLPVDPVDRLPSIEFDEDEIVSLVKDEKERIDNARSEWLERKYENIRQWDDYLTYPSETILEGQKNVHIPVTHEKIQAWHARMYKSIFSMDPIFSMEPLNLVTKEEVEATKTVLWWYLKNEVNYRQGLKPFVDELLWDIGTDGWGIAYKRWETVQRKMLDIKFIERNLVKEQIQEALGELKKKGRITKSYQEVERIVQRFSGIILETVPHECVYFPDYIPTSGDMNYPKLVMIEREYDEDSIRVYKKSGFYDEEAAETIIEVGKGGIDPRKTELKRERERMSGIQESYSRGNEAYSLFTVFLRKDLHEEGYPQEYIFTVSLQAGKVARATYLDRVCRSGNRPIYKFDLLKRPRSSYSRGWVELLYPLNMEIDEFHNFRRAAGKIANMPWGFYRAGSGLEKENIVVKPGRFYPLDDPQNDVRAMTFGNVTTWAMQEEALAQTYADKLTAMPPMMQGQVPQQVGPLRSTSGLNAIMGETQAPLDVYLDRFRGPFGSIFSDCHEDLKVRLPDSIKIAVLGERAGLMFGAGGEYLGGVIDKRYISKNFKFSLSANDAQYNPEKDKQEAIVNMQLGLSQFPVQMGLTSPENAYWLMREVYEKRGVKDIDKFLTRPQMADRPLTIWQEYSSCLNGIFPKIVLNDDHETKANQLNVMGQSPEYLQAKQTNQASPLSDLLLGQTIQTHMKYFGILQNMQQFNTQTGSNVPATAGARATGAEVAGGTRAEEQRNGQGRGGANGGANATPPVGEGEQTGGENVQ